MMHSTAFRVILICLCGAMICAMLRTQRPEIAAAVSLAIGLGALLMTGSAFASVFDGVLTFVHASDAQDGMGEMVVRAAGISILSELGVQICCDAGESALAGRIRLATRVVLLGMAMPMVSQISDTLNGLFA